ncbi:DUF2726 domain-containing protein [Tardiphaga sp.]|uniref:DUF2726 domain-containing protein n=1 Tax=Tardiphaga sp. TaxID=1926292 RepID=UPI003529FA77
MPIGLIIFIGCAFVLLALLKGSSGPPTPIAKEFMTKREQAMLAALEHVLPMYRVHAQVAMGALLAAPRRPGQRFNPADRNAFSQKIVDFVIVDPTLGKVVALVELDDRSHDRAKDRVRDAMTARAGYKTIRIAGSARPTIPTAIEAVGHLRDVELLDGRAVA